MRKTIVTICTAAAFVAVGSFAPADASTAGESNTESAGTVQAAARGCASRAEFRRVRHHMTRTRVSHILDSKGKLSLVFAGSQTRDYRTCARFSSISVSYDRGPGGVWRVTDKFGFFL